MKYRYRVWAPPSHSCEMFRAGVSLREFAEQRLSPLKDRSAAYRAYRLFLFILRWHGAPAVKDPQTGAWSEPNAFPLDRRALSSAIDLDLTEAEIRTASRTLVREGFIERLSTTGSAYRSSKDGPRRKAILYRTSFEVRRIISVLALRKAVYRSKPKRTFLNAIAGYGRASQGELGLQAPRRSRSRSANAPSSVNPTIRANAFSPGLEAVMARLAAGLARRSANN